MWPNLLSSRLIPKPTHGSWWKVGGPHRLDSALVNGVVSFGPRSDDPKLPVDSGEVPISKWSGWWFDSCCQIFSLLGRKY